MIKQKKGSIINVSSMSAYIVNYPQKQCHYNTSKAGVVQLTKSLAVEWAPYNVSVNVVFPGYIMTPLLKEADKKYLNQWISTAAAEEDTRSFRIKGHFCISGF